VVGTRHPNSDYSGHAKNIAGYNEEFRWGVHHVNSEFYCNETGDSNSSFRPFASNVQRHPSERFLRCIRIDGGARAGDTISADNVDWWMLLTPDSKRTKHPMNLLSTVESMSRGNKASLICEMQPSESLVVVQLNALLSPVATNTNY
jgi:hypothetical protein